MATPKRVLYVAGAISPFVNGSETAELVRTLSEQLHTAGGYEARLTMPCYGTISERTHQLHEVIRLSGTEIEMSGSTETLTVKVASIPDLRLQVYFMDNEKYFGRKGRYTSKDGTSYDDNAARALFFGRSVLTTIQKLRWAPDVVHAFGWMGGLVPLLLKTEFAGTDVFTETRVAFTPDGAEAQANLSPAFASERDISIDGDLAGCSFDEAGCARADAVIYPPSLAASGTTAQFSSDAEVRTEQVAALYEGMLEKVPA